MLQDNISNLFDLIRFRFSAPRLQIQNFGNAIVAEDVVISADPFFETESFEDAA
jgi:hypothetical protein